MYVMRIAGLSHLFIVCRKMQRAKYYLIRSVRKLNLLKKITLVCGTLTRRMDRWLNMKYLLYIKGLTLIKRARGVIDLAVKGSTGNPR